ncbi:MAG TPA: prepilin-type N-terminal cleavage/methylation domain-containing protein [Phycisphaerales bacterium]|nr:prepilin-type N-terminal cleavage/methylation domain-containing protein [Phycisphaerales bacterium]
MTTHTPNAAVRTPRPAHRAFTLVELVAVIVILAVMAGVASMQASSMSAASRLQWASRQVARDLSFARERAMTTGTTHWCRFDTAGQYYTVLAEDPSAPGYAGATALIDPASQAPFVTSLNRNEWNGITLATGGTFSGVNYTVGFNKLGRPLITAGTALTTTTGPTLQVSSGGGAGTASTVTVATGTGRIVY